jgi:hypothetical protein
MSTTSLRDARVFRHPDGRSWRIELRDLELRFEITLPDDEPVIRKRGFASIPDRDTEVRRLIDEQRRDGFVADPAWRPTAEWVRAAPDEALNINIIDPFSIWFCASEDALRASQPCLRHVVCIDLLQNECLRNGIDSFVVQMPGWLVAEVVAATASLGLAEASTLWQRATNGVDLAAAHGAPRVAWGDARAARRLKLLIGVDEGDAIKLGVRRTIRDHAEVVVDAWPNAVAADPNVFERLALVG